MLSLRSFSEHQGREAANTLQRVVCILLEGIALNVFRGSGPSARAFQGTISTLRSQFAGLAFGDEDQEISICNKVVACLERYGDEMESISLAGSHKLQDTLAMFTEALSRIAKEAGAEAEIAAHTMERAGSELVGALRLDDLTSANIQLRQSLDAICAATAKHENLRNQIERELTIARQPGRAMAGDPATGLAGRPDAIQTLSSLTEGTRPGHVLAFSIEHFEAIGTRFGVAVSIRVLQLFAQHLAQNLHASEKLFRWHGACFVVTTDEGLPDSMLAAEAARLAISKLEYSGSVGSREFVLPITCSWTLLPVLPGAPLEGVVRTLDEFTTGRLAGSRHGGHSASSRY